MEHLANSEPAHYLIYHLQVKLRSLSVMEAKASFTFL